MHGQDVAPALQVGGLEGDVAVEAPGTHEGGVEDVGAVGGGDDDDARRRVEAVHLHQQLVEGLLTLAA